MIFFRVSSSVSSHSVAAAAYSTSNFLQSSVLPSARVVRRKKKSVPNTAARAPDSLGVVADIESNIEATSTDGDAHALLEMMHTATGCPTSGLVGSPQLISSNLISVSSDDGHAWLGRRAHRAVCALQLPVLPDRLAAAHCLAPALQTC